MNGRCLEGDIHRASLFQAKPDTMAYFPLKETSRRFFIPTKSATKGQPGLSKISLTSPICSIGPLFITAPLPASDRTSARSWVTIKKVVVEDW